MSIACRLQVLRKKAFILLPHFLRSFTNSYFRTVVACYSSINVHYKGSDATLFMKARTFPDRIAIIDCNGTFTYSQLLQHSKTFGHQIAEKCHERNGDKLVGKRVAFLCPNDVSYVAVQWGIWRYGGIAVPLCSTHPNNMLEYFIRDSQSTILVSTEQFHAKLTPLVERLNIPYLTVSTEKSKNPIDSGLTPFERSQINWDEKGAIIFYTSGTTGKPKGVLITHGNIRAQVFGMVKAWQWTESDRILHVLPLHHVHGVINVLACPLSVGATCVMQQKFDAEKIWQHLMDSNLSLFMAVPTIYSKLIEHYHKRNWNVNEIKKKCSQLRLMVSGSSALPEPTMVEWLNLTGHTLLERYGMTEIGMALSNPLHGTRKPGSVGVPLPGVQVRIVVKDEEGFEHDDQILVEGDEHGSTVKCTSGHLQGALQVRGASVFKSYWQKPDATSESFTSDGWFRTGDIAEYKDEVYKILGRASVDIIKSGGYKISALDIERELLAHPSIRDCAVLGIPDMVWGERVAAIVSLHPDKSLSLEDIRTWSKERLSRYQTPSKLNIVTDIPRNTMGKVNKKELLKSLVNENQN